VDAAHGFRVRQGVVENFPEDDGECGKDRKRTTDSRAPLDMLRQPQLW
jgi:hypothetical protein